MHHRQCIQVLPKVKAWHDAVGVPFGHWQFDSWFYKKDGPVFRGGAVLNWTAAPDVFPHGIAHMQSLLRVPLVMHNRMWSVKSDYIAHVPEFAWYQVSLLGPEGSGGEGRSRLPLNSSALGGGGGLGGWGVPDHIPPPQPDPPTHHPSPPPPSSDGAKFCSALSASFSEAEAVWLLVPCVCCSCPLCAVPLRRFMPLQIFDKGLEPPRCATRDGTSWLWGKGISGLAQRIALHYFGTRRGRGQGASPPPPLQWNSGEGSGGEGRGTEGTAGPRDGDTEELRAVQQRV